MRACCDLAERSARLIEQNKVSEERAAVLAEDLQRYCPTAGMYAQWLLDNRDVLPLPGNKDRRRSLRQRRNALQQWNMKLPAETPFGH